MSGLWCQLRLTVGGRDFLVKLPDTSGHLAYPPATFWLHNATAEPVGVLHRYNVLEHLALDVLGRDGVNLSRSVYGNKYRRITATPPEQTLTIAAGESWSAEVVLLACNIDPLRLTAGRYRAFAQYQLGDVVLRSEPLEFEVRSAS